MYLKNWLFQSATGNEEQLWELNHFPLLLFFNSLRNGRHVTFIEFLYSSSNEATDLLFGFFLMKCGNLFSAFIQHMLGKVSQTCKHLSFIYSEKLFVFPVRENFVPWCFNQKLQTIVFSNTFHFLLIEDWIPWANSMANTLLQSFNSVFSSLKLLQQSPGHLRGRPDQVAGGQGEVTDLEGNSRSYSSDAPARNHQALRSKAGMPPSTLKMSLSSHFYWNKRTLY